MPISQMDMYPWPWCSRYAGTSGLPNDLYKQALALDLNNPDALHWYSQLLAETGHLKEALSVRQRLRILEAFVPVFNWNYAAILWLNGQKDDANAILTGLPQDAPVFGRLVIAFLDASDGRYREAADIVQKIPAEALPPGLADAAAGLLRTAPTKAASPYDAP